ncbi:MAG: proline--tRNA ligase, partial [Thermoflexales bacterium]|nr:proline--tRNA ligase [Thermoflexales bacterium]
FKFNDWEMRGVPLRIEIGPKDVDKQQVVLARRDKPGREGKSFVSQDGLLDQVREMLDTIQAEMYQQALKFQQDNTRPVKDLDELKAAVQAGFAMAWWCGKGECEAKIKEETKATSRCIPLGQAGGQGACVCCGQAASEQAVFARAY